MYLAGVDYDRFGKLTLKDMRIIAKAYSEKTKVEFEVEDTMAFIQGRYFLQALLATVGNMFRDKGSKPHSYPDKPYSQNKEVPLTEEEIQRQRELFIANLKTMETNFNLNKKNEQSGESQA